MATQPVINTAILIGKLPIGYIPLHQQNPDGYNYMSASNSKLATILIKTNGDVIAIFTESSTIINILHVTTSFVCA